MAESHFRVSAAGRTDVGRERDHNEDRMLLRPDVGLFVVADGMGGHNAGEVASALCALSLENCFLAARSGPLPDDLMADPRPLSLEERTLVAAARKANADVFEISRTHPQHGGMGTTLVALHVSEATREMHVAHVGDSRCYRLRGGKLEQLTRDHSLISDAIAFKPDITEAELALFPKNVISRCVGRAPSVEIDVRTEKLAAGDVLLVCSDGLSSMVGDDVILRCLLENATPEAVCQAAIDAANAAGGADNITVIVVRIDPA
ncbi:MAG TPA: protein phosphatase 2C domain-containing protein [Polyangiaceae bacterium]|nr:protein phosphatase 2C domain-containing protein [Polyangiaceae bacterium]